MSGIAHPQTTVRLRPHATRLTLIVATALVVAVAILVIALSSGSTESSHATGASAVQTSGPNEALRGQSAAQAAGAYTPSPTGGPDETRRGNAAASAARP
jgi:negative regulator of sigma E activity